MSDKSIRFNLRNQYVLTSTYSNFQNITLPNIITTNETQYTSLNDFGNTILSRLQTHEFNTTIEHVQALSLAGLQQANSNVSVTQNILITTGQI